MTRADGGDGNGAQAQEVTYSTHCIGVKIDQFKSTESEESAGVDLSEDRLG